MIGGFAVSALVSGAVKAASNKSSTAPAIMPSMENEEDLTPLHDRRVFGTPGASLHAATQLGLEARQAGIEGEERVAQELEHLAASYPNTYVFHSVKLPGKMGDIDHLVIQGNVMLLVDTKNWKHSAEYNIQRSTFEADFVTRDGEDFLGGEIHLPRQIAEWQVEFMDSSLDVQAVLVIANRKSSVSETINAPYSIANISGLASIFSNTFDERGVAPLHPVLLQRVLSMVQSPTLTTPMVPRQVRTRQPATTMTKWLVAWSFFNYTVMLLLFPLAGLSALPLLVLTHRHKNEIKEKNLGGTGLLTAVLIFTYILLIGWAMAISMVFMWWGRPVN